MLIKKDEIPSIFGRSAAAFLIFAAFAGCTALPDLPRRHMISAANPLASEAGRKIMRQGGGAVDAAIAAQAVLTLVEPQSSGIGGGGAEGGGHRALVRRAGAGRGARAAGVRRGAAGRRGGDAAAHAALQSKAHGRC